MSQLFGILNKTGEPVSLSHLNKMQNAVQTWLPDRVDQWVQGRVGLSRLLRFNTPQSRNAKTEASQQGGKFQIVFDGRLDNRSDLIATLGPWRRPHAELTDDELTLAAYQKWGRTCCSRLLGDFAFAIWDGVSQQLFLARDHMGIRPLFLAENENRFAFASNRKALLALPWVDTEHNQQWIADVLCMCKANGHETLYRGITAARPAHWVAVGSAASISTERYWQLDPDKELSLSTDEEYIEQFQALLHDAVACRLNSSFPIASELSGGLDSTTITSQACQLAQKSNQQFFAVSHVLAPEHEGVLFPFTDEQPWIDDLLKFAGVQNHIKLTGRNIAVVENLENCVRTHAGPTRNDLNGHGQEIWEQLRENQCRVLLSGFGGDHVVTSLGLGFVEELGRSGDLKTLWRELRASGNNKASVSRSCLHWFLRRQIVGMEHLFQWRDDSLCRRQRDWAKYSRALAVKPEFAERHGFPERYWDNPSSPWSGTVREQEFVRINGPAVQYRVEDCAIGAETAGVEYRYPLLDIRFLEFCLSLPMRQKRRDGVRRRMLRVSSQRILPESIRRRDTKTGNTIPSLNQRMYHDRHQIMTRLESMRHQLGDSEYFDLQKLPAMANDFCAAEGPERGSSRGLRRVFLQAFQLMHTLTCNAASRSYAA